MIQIPHTKIWTQLNGPDNQGDLWSSFNVDLSEREGKLRAGKRLIVNTNTTDVAALSNYPVGFKFFNSGNGYKFTVAGSYVFSVTPLYPSGFFFSQLTAGSAPSTCNSTQSDLIIDSLGNLYVSTSTESVYYTTDGVNWSSFSAGASDNTGTHCLANYLTRTYISKSGNQILSWDDSTRTVTSIGGTFSLTLGISEVITFIRVASDRLWIGTINALGAPGYVYEWDGTLVNTPQKSHRLDSAGAVACVIKDDIPWLVDVNGRLLYWNGGTFIEPVINGLQAGHLNRKNNKNLFNNLSKVNNRFIHPNGMAIIQGKINLLIDGRNYTPNLEIEETIPSGVYEFDPNKGLVHKYSFGLSHSGDGISDYGQIKINGAGGLAEDNLPSKNSDRNGTLLAGASYFVDATNTSSAVFYDDSNDTLQKVASIVTSKIDADDATPYHLPSIQNSWQNVYSLYKKLLNASDKIVVKYRTLDYVPFEVTITWTSTTTFTTSTSLIGFEGYEVEGIQGTGSGYCAHITKIDQVVSGSTITYTVTLDDAFTGASGTAIVRINNWKKISTINQSGATYDHAGMGDLSSWVQFKYFMLFTGRNEIERILIANQNMLPAH